MQDSGVTSPRSSGCAGTGPSAETPRRGPTPGVDPFQAFIRGGENMKKPYVRPEVEEWSVAGLTQVGQTNPGDDVLPGDAYGKDGGSINPDGLG